jgi:decaprenylphospho-beta-D-erythro-pentofuranosid-2-ulose 2-reductase
MNVVIFGATSRIAQALVRHYAAAGASIAVAARDLPEAERIAHDAAVRFGVTTFAVPFDATAFDSHDAVVKDVSSRLGHIDVGIVAFGEMGDQHTSEEHFAAARHVMEVNYLGAASISEALVRAIAQNEPISPARGRGTVVGISSVAGERGRKSNYVYGSAKGAYTLYLDGLRGRAHPLGVHVLTAKLGFVDTRMTFGLGGKIPVASPESAAAAIHEAVECRTDELYYPAFWRPIMAAIRAIPPKLFKRLSI